MRLIATKEVNYADVIRKVGDEFDASDEDARLLIGWEKARAAATTAVVTAPVKPSLFENKAETAAVVHDEGADAASRRTGKRHYQRRDMVSEG